MICMTIIWSSASFTYYLISYQMKYLKGDLWINGLMSSMSEAVANTLAVILFSCFGLSRVMSVSFLTALIGMLCLIIVPTEN